ncbi:hypothetical protein [uncultured Georgenia sp.]|uniref:hypothetical protein n=1 Tax=uncultured Georgenia sp. TaxID=378209 RepID=UPI0026315F7B|nr:hypothetical protein [uncultured Georgenia sp.]HLV04098.1 hypothetical protein [Actinomycetaceae bacterium]
MTRRLILPAVLLLGLAGCSSSTSDDTSAPEETAAQSPEVAVCEGFYEGTGTPLAERAENAREALTAGEVEAGASYSEVNALEQRITELGSDAPTDLATLLEEINAPFTEAVAAVNEASAAEVPEGEEPQFPDLSTIDVSGSEAAQAEFETACADAGYGA